MKTKHLLFSIFAAVGLVTGCRLNKNGELIIKNVNGEYILADKKFDWQSNFDSAGRSEVNYHGDFGYVNKEFRCLPFLV